MAPSLSWIERSSIQELAARVHGRPSTLPPAPTASSARVRFGVGGSVDAGVAVPRPAPEHASLPPTVPPRFAPLPPPPPPMAPPAGSVPPMPVVPAPVRPPPPGAPPPASAAAPLASAPPAPRPVPLRSAKEPATTSSASWQRPSFQSVEIDAGALGLDLDALRRALPPSSGPTSSPPARAPTAPPHTAAPSSPPVSSAPAREAIPSPPRLVRAPPTVPAATAPAAVPTNPVATAPVATRPRYDEEEGELVPLSGGQVSPSISLSSVLQGTFDEKLEVFVHWLMGSTGAFAAFVVDDQGLEVANRHATEDLLAVSALIDRSLSEARQVLAGQQRDGSFSLELDEQNVLHVIWADVAGSRFGIGLVVRDALEGKLTQAIRRSFRAVAATTEAQPRSA